MSDRVVLITGGTGGLGKAVTKAFLDRGDRVVMTYRRESERDKLVDGIDAGGRLLPISADVTREADVLGVVENIVTQFGRVDVLVHLVGGYAGGQTVAETPVATLERMLTLNLTSAFLVVKAVLPHMQTQRSGKIVLVSSRGAVQVGAGAGAYAASKAGVAALAQTVAAEYDRFGINANTIVPGMIDTEANRAAMPDADRSSWVSPEHIAEIIVFLCSSEAASVNGAAVPIYGRT